MAYVVRWQRGILWCSFLQLLLVVLLLALVHAQGASQDVINAVTEQRIGTLDSRVLKLEDEVRRNNADARLLVLESDMTEVKWLGRSVAMLVAGQLITMLMGLRNGKPRHP